MRLWIALIFVAAISAQPQPSLELFLRHFVGNQPTQYAAAFRDLDGDGVSEAIIYLTSQGWCGSGGCTMLILRQNAGTWKLVTKVPIVRPPIAVQETWSHGWRNLSVWVQGGGIQPGFTAELQFDGRTYSGNPSIAPPGMAGGEIVLDGSRVVSLPVPSFDCAKASTPAEEAVCADAELSDKDRAMASAYRVALQGLPPDRAGELRREQTSWLSEYAKTCNAVQLDDARRDCIDRHLSTRIVRLQGLVR